MPSLNSLLYFRQALILIFVLILVHTSMLTSAQFPKEMNKGLSNSSVKSIFQDSQGYMWFGTFDGLNRFDGYDIKTYRNQLNNENSIPHNYIYCIAEDRNKKLWIGTGQGIGIYDRNFDTFSRLNYIDQKSKQSYHLNADTKSIQIDSDNNIYIGTNGWGLFYKSHQEAYAIQIAFKDYKSNQSNLYYHVSATHIDATGRVWVFIEGSGLYTFDKKTQQLNLVSKAITSATCMASTNSGELFIGNYEGLFVWKIKEHMLSSLYPQELKSSQINMLTLEGQNKLWLATQNNGIFILNLSHGKAVNKSDLQPAQFLLNSKTIYMVYIDSQRKIWIGTGKGGIETIDNNGYKFNYLQQKHYAGFNLAHKFVRSFVEYDNKIWIGTEGNGLYVWDDKTNQVQSFQKGPQQLPDNTVNHLLTGNHGDLWIATERGIARYAKGSGFKYYACRTANGVLNNSVQLLFKDQDAKIWAATFSEGRVYTYNPTRDQFEVFSEDIYDINCMIDDQRGNIWMGNYNEIIQLNKQTQKSSRYLIGKPVRAIQLGKNNRLWLGTEGKGLLAFDSKSKKIVENYSTNEGLSNNAVLNILEDKTGKLWLSTFNGLSKFDPSTKKFVRYEETDGLQSNEFSYGAALKLKNGHLLFGGNNGFNIFDADSIKLKIYEPALAITSLKINNKKIADLSDRVDIGKDHSIHKLTLPYNQSTFSLEFAALEFDSPQKIKYRYLLEGLDKGWNDAGSTRSINYNGLHEGDYTLLIQSTDSEGNWTNKQIKLEIQILPPWYRSWWAYLLYTLAIAYIGLWYLRYRRRQIALNYEIQLSKFTIQKERELNEKRHAFFTNISHEFRTPLTLIINPIKDLLKTNKESKDNASLQVVHRNAKRLLSLVDQLLVFRKTEDGAEQLKTSIFDCQSFMKEIFLYFAAQAKLQNIDYQFLENSDPIYVNADKEKIEIILCNLISNAFKFTPSNGAIHIALSQQGRELTIQIKDSGKGIPEHLGDRIFDKYFSDPLNGPKKQTGFGIGMYLVKTFVEMHAGTISYTSSATAGTTFDLVLPIIAQQTPAEEPLADVALHNESGIQMLYDSQVVTETVPLFPTAIASKKFSVLLVDDDAAIRSYLTDIFKEEYTVYNAHNGVQALDMIKEKQPDLVISDIIMEEMDGLSLCKAVKSNATLNHIQIILLTSSTSDSTKLAGIQYGADDYIHKPFDSEILLLRVKTLLQNKKNLQDFFFNAITLQSNELKIPITDKLLIERCIEIIEENLLEELTVISLAEKTGMSHSSLYKKIKTISGKSINEFIRSVRLKKAAEMLILTDSKINEVANLTGFYDQRYFRQQFSKLFGHTPSDYVKKYRKAFQNEFHVDRP
ncbi:hybrid sensor histidine kinase/response regulator transcription factor [Sphingobacterium puteale]|uniref:hybrid sensor histidine kinase/response regulator transcription factor n=1 Tax=Sphingobacterium puteale TaxID=2420510 RepID=UPI003D95D1D5